ncbi:MAG: MFS transporter [Azospirillaceae bacterium]|nr:MFS transporter [Azospirillaceae bacterium]
MPDSRDPRTTPAETAPGTGLTPLITRILMLACGAIVANLYYAQPLIGPIAAATGLSPGAAGLIVTLTQVGYGIGLLLIVPLGDLIENRRLILGELIVTTLALITAAFATRAALFLGAALMIGVGAVAAQILVPFASHLAPAAVRGRVVGTIMSGLLLGIMLARPIASLVADLWGWHVIFILSAVAMCALTVVLARTLPRRQPPPGLGYGALLGSMVMLLRATPILRRRALYQACLFAAFSLFWTTVPLLLAGPRFNFSQRGIALFAFAGVAGAIAAPIAGRWADRGWSRPVTGIALVMVTAAFGISRIDGRGDTLAVAALVAAAIMLDMGVSANLVLGQRAIYALRAEYRSRLNGLFMAMFFAGGAVGSALGAWCYAEGGWPLSSALGAVLPLIALVHYAGERKAEPGAGPAP